MISQIFEKSFCYKKRVKLQYKYFENDFTVFFWWQKDKIFLKAFIYYFECIL